MSNIKVKDKIVNIAKNIYYKYKFVIEKRYA